MLRCHVSEKQKNQAIQIEQLQCDIEEAVTSPVAAIASQISQLIETGNLTDSVKDSLGLLLQKIYQATPGVYRPALKVCAIHVDSCDYGLI